MNNDNLSFDDALFEYRNKEYGAYVLRRSQNINQAKGMLVAFGIVLLMIITPGLMAKFYKPSSTIDADLLKEVVLESSPPLPQQERPDPPAARASVPPMNQENIAQIQNVTPNVVPNDSPDIDELPPTRQAIDSSAISTSTQPGNNQKNTSQIPVLVSGSGNGPNNGLGVMPKDTIYSYPSVMPEYNGGYKGLQEYLNKNIKYPRLAIDNEIEGKVVVTFVVSKTGTIDDVKLIRGIGGGCDEEAMRVIKAMPNWKPGLHRNQTVKVSYTLPVGFQLQR